MTTSTVLLKETNSPIFKSNVLFGTYKNLIRYRIDPYTFGVRGFVPTERDVSDMKVIVCWFIVTTSILNQSSLIKNWFKQI